MSWTLSHLPDIAWATWQHVLLVSVSIAIGFVISLAAGVHASRRPRVYAAVMAATAVLYAIPSLALFAILIPLVGLGTVPAVIGLVSYSLLIMIRNIATGLREVPADVVDAARGMGLAPWQVLVRVELPLAMPDVAPQP